LPGKHIFTTLLEGWTLDIQEEDGHNNSFSLGLAGEEEEIA
jgi:hypothetical protein